MLNIFHLFQTLPTSTLMGCTTLHKEQFHISDTYPTYHWYTKTHLKLERAACNL